MHPWAQLCSQLICGQTPFSPGPAPGTWVSQGKFLRRFQKRPCICMGRGCGRVPVRTISCLTHTPKATRVPEHEGRSCQAHSPGERAWRTGCGAQCPRLHPVPGRAPPTSAINHQCRLFSASCSHPSLHFSLVLLAPSSRTDIIHYSKAQLPPLLGSADGFSPATRGQLATLLPPSPSHHFQCLFLEPLPSEAVTAWKWV